MSYAVPQVDWSPLGNLLNTYQDARRKAERERILRDAGQSQELNLSQLGQRLLGTGDLDAGVSLYRLGQQQRQLDAQTRASQDFMRIFGGDAPAPASPAAPPAPTSSGIPPGLVASESGGNFRAQNDAVGAGGQRGHFGRLQFGQARLQEAAAAGAIPQGTTPQQFVASPEMQQSAERWHFGDIDAKIQQNGLGRFVGQSINGIPVTLNGMRAVAHLGGSEGLRRFLVSGGQYNPADRNGTRLSDYLARMGRGDEAAPVQPAGTGVDEMWANRPRIDYAAGGAPVQVASAPTGTTTDAPVVTGALPPISAAPAPAAAQQAPQARVTTGTPAPAPAGPLDRLSVQQLVAASANPNLSEGMRQTAQTLLKAKLESSRTPDDIQKYLFARAQGETRSYSDWRIAMQQAGATRVNQNNTQQAESIEQKERLQGLSGQLNEIAKQGGQVAQRSADLDMAGRILSRMQTGPGTDLRATLDGIGRQLGLSSGALKTQADAVNAIVQRIAPTLRQPGSGAQSDAELRGFLASLPSITALPEGNQLILGTLRRAAEIDRERLKIATDWQSNRITATVAADRLAAINQRSIFASDAERELVANIMGGQPLSGAPQPEGQNNNWRVIGVQ